MELELIPAQFDCMLLCLLYGFNDWFKSIYNNVIWDFEQEIPRRSSYLLSPSFRGQFPPTN